jgi:hypothetical protein
MPAAAFADRYFAFGSLVLGPFSIPLLFTGDAIQPNPYFAPFVFGALNDYRLTPVGSLFECNSRY